MPVKPSGIHTSAGMRRETVGAGRSGHAGTAGWRAAPVLMRVASAAAANAPAIGRDRGAMEDYNPRMAVLSRREFGSALIAGVPLAAVMGSIRLSAAQVTVGVSTSSFRDLPRVAGRDNVDDVVRAL